MEIQANSALAGFDLGTIRMDRQTAMPFIFVSLVWLFIGEAVCIRFIQTGQSFFPAAQWMALLWAFCLFDLYSLARAVGAALSLVSAEGEKRGALMIQAFYWGTIKLVCLGILGAILLRGNTMPATSLLMGSATLIIVPLLGGYWWSQKVLRHA